jgi:outer membrane murein-binding lipoprotein Lpp
MDIDSGAAEAAPDAGTVDTATPSNETNDIWSSIDSTMDKAYDKVNPVREDNGQFKGDAKVAPAEGEPEAKPESTEATPTAPSNEPPPAAITAPQSLPAELKALWDKAPPELKPLLEWKAQREAESHKRISELGQTVKATEPIRNVIDHYKADFQARNMDPAQGVAAMLEVQRMLDSDFEGAISEIARVYGKPSPFASSQSQEPGQESGEVRALKAEIAALKRDVGQTREHVMAEQRSKQEREAANLATLVDEFSKDKPDFSEIEGDVVAHIHAIRAAEPGLDNKALLAKAYEAARWANPATRTKMLEAQRTAEEAKRAEETKKKAAEAQRAAKLNVRSSNGTSPARKGSWEQTMEAAADAAFGR